MKKLPIKTYDPGKDKMVTVGYIKDKTFYKTINPRKHFIRAMGCYSIQDNVKDLLISLEENNDLNWIIFLMNNPKKQFRMNIKKLKDCKPVSRKICEKHGNQTAIWLSQMKEEKYGTKEP